MEYLNSIIILAFVSAVFISVGVIAIFKETPMHFWAGSKVNSEKITNVKAYNKANCMMWISYGITFILAGFALPLFGEEIIKNIVTFLCTGGLIIMIFVYYIIYQKHIVK
ncbi:hypothetical protein ACERII_13255 [Evansella sp. AB-rgal1]|uniref:hypothetical protein n=1 Tax=Evansella sp. AB-rgal1 TaxID=3242696 RepID=UPI00359DAE75